MAISDILPGVKIEIIVNGAALKEYEDDTVNDEERTVTRYVEAASGQVFEVLIEVSPAFKFEGERVRFQIHADGVCVDSPLIAKSAFNVTRLSEGREVAGGKVKRYRFASLETVSDGKISNGQAHRVKDLGTIAVQCDHRMNARRSILRSGEESAELGAVSEKALKGRTVSHNVDFAEPQTKCNGATQFWVTEPVPRIPEHAATFIFCYRSIDALKSMLIVPRTPSPPPLEERDFTTLTQDELKELQRRVQASRVKKEAQVNIKHEDQDKNPRPKKRARPSPGKTRLELDEDGNFRESSTPVPTTEKVVIELD